MYADNTVSAHDILTLKMCLVVFVRYTDNNQQLHVFIVPSVTYSRYGLRSDIKCRLVIY